MNDEYQVGTYLILVGVAYNFFLNKFLWGRWNEMGRYHRLQHMYPSMEMESINVVGLNEEVYKKTHVWYFYDKLYVMSGNVCITLDMDICFS